MWIRVRTMDGKQCVTLEGVSKLTKMEEIRKMLVSHLNVEPARQRLFYRGKQLEDGHTLFDYDVSLNDIIQVLVRPPPLNDGRIVKATAVPAGTSQRIERMNCRVVLTNIADTEIRKNTASLKSQDTVKIQECSVKQSSYYKVGDQVDVWDSETGSWHESKIAKIVKDADNDTKWVDNNSADDANNNKVELPLEEPLGVDGKISKKAKDGYVYHVLYDGYEEPSEAIFGIMRPRSWKKLTLDEISVGDEVLVNYYVDEPSKRGYWYDAKITDKEVTSRTDKQLVATLSVGMDEIPLDNCKVKFLDEILRIEKPVKLSSRDEEMEYFMQQVKIPKREVKPNCDYCKDRATTKCKWCSCQVCGGKDQPSKQLLCDECNQAFHLWCLDPPLESLPDDEHWYCPRCKNDDTEVVKAGEKLKLSKKKSKMASVIGNCSRDWGKGMACVGRTKHCTIVPQNHFGPIPGVEVGSSWKFRLLAAEAGVHRAHVAGIHGREHEGAYSIVLAAGYEDDEDDGDEFTYTGSGGRDLSGNRRTAQQSSDQVLTRHNKALALNCNAPVNTKVGAEAGNWQGGKPVRVLRSYKGRQHSKYSPKTGFRYDGIYKVVKYWPAKGKSGFTVWRYLLRRDDPTPAPWTKAGKKRIEELGLVMQYPEGYVEKDTKLESDDVENVKLVDKKRKRTPKDEEAIESKRPKQIQYKLPSPIAKLIKNDVSNQHLWKECLQDTVGGQVQFISKVQDIFMCVCCQDIVCKPITTECNHNVCQSCLKRAFKVGIHSCPVCRFSFGKDYVIQVNEVLTEILKILFPGYENGR